MALEREQNFRRDVYRAFNEPLDVDLHESALRRTLEKALMASRYFPLCAGARAEIFKDSLRNKGI